MSTATPPAPLSAGPEQPRLSGSARIINTFVAPSKTFDDIARKPTWWVPWLLVSIFSLIFIYSVDQKIGFERITRQEIQRSPRAQQFESLPPEQREQQMRIAAKVTQAFAYGTPVFALIGGLLVAAILMATFNFGFAAEVSFPQAMGIVFYAWLPSTISGLLATISLYASSDLEGFNIRNPVATNPAYFMDPAGSKYLLGLLRGVEVFVIWIIVLMGVGFAVNSKNRKLTKGAAIATVAALFIVYKLVFSALGF
jgi:Yip1 domain